MKVKLYAHPDYWSLTKEEKKEVCNGCGAKGAWYNFLIPGGIFKEVCNIHDYDYKVGKTLDDKRKADRRFIQNMKRVVSATDNKFLRKYRKIKSRGFYKAVRDLGEEAFWANKIVDEKNSEGREVTI